ncbi:MAG: c-type cytochrome [Verrucomicrobia bacterium]|nr:c-type cytochrome [Verrucomicrobiota bacterium]
MNCFCSSRIPVAWVCLATLTGSAQIPQPTDAPAPSSPETTAASFVLPPGFKLEVIAAEPLIASPSGICWDHKGRMFVSELHGYNLPGQLDVTELNKTGKLDTEVRRVAADKRFYKAAEPGTYGVIKLLRDTNNDGRMDAADIWTTNLPPVYGIVPARDGIIAACAPEIVFVADRDGDGRAEVRETLFSGFRTGELERGINAPLWGEDGWIYFGRGWGGGSISGPRLKAPVELPGSDFRIRSDGSAIEPVTGSTHTFGHTFTDSEERFVVSTTTSYHVAPLPWRYLVRNPSAATSGLQAGTGDRRAYARSQPHPWRRHRAQDTNYFKFYRDRYGASDSDAGGWFTSMSSPFVYRDSVLPGLTGHYFVCEPAGNLIHRALIERDGSVLTLRRAPGEESTEFAASTDPWSHPMNILHGPDGRIWIVDYYREIIEDYSAIPRHLQQQYGLYAGHDRGRIYRLTHAQSKPMEAKSLADMDIPSWVEECTGSLLWRRQTAQRLLIERGDNKAGGLVRSALKRPSNPPQGIITLLRTLAGLELVLPADVTPFLSHPAPEVRVHALQLGDKLLGQSSNGGLLEALISATASETHPRVLLQVALSLGESPDPKAVRELVRLAQQHGSIRWMQPAVLSSLAGRSVDFLASWMAKAEPEASWVQAVSETVGAGRNEGELGKLLTLLGTSKPANQALAVRSITKGRKNAPRTPLTEIGTKRAMGRLGASPVEEVRVATRALEETFLPSAPADDEPTSSQPLPADLAITETTFKPYVDALSQARDPARGKAVFLQACASCHRVGAEGHDLGPDLMGQLGLGEESLLKDILLPNERIRPGYETVLVTPTDGLSVIGILRDDGATSLTLGQASGAEQIMLRKDLSGIRRLPGSLMPSFAEALTPADVANLLGWLKSQAEKPAKP